MQDESQTQTQILAELDELRQRLNWQMRMHDNMDAAIYTLVHDLRRSLALILGFSEWLLKSDLTLTAAEREKYLQIIYQSGKEMDVAIDHLFLLVHVRDDELPNNHPLEMKAVVGEAVDRLRYIIEQKRATLTLAETWPAAVGYGPWMEELWYALLSEALWLSGDGARLTLGGEATESGPRFWVRVEDADPVLRARLASAEPSALVQRLLAQLGGQMEQASEDALTFTLKA